MQQLQLAGKMHFGLIDVKSWTTPVIDSPECFYSEHRCMDLFSFLIRIESVVFIVVFNS